MVLFGWFFFTFIKIFCQSVKLLGFFVGIFVVEGELVFLPHSPHLTHLLFYSGMSLNETSVLSQGRL